MKISDKFRIENAKSSGFIDYEIGDIPFVTNGIENKGVLGLVKPKPGDKIFKEKTIVVSSFCEVSVQNPPFLPRGNGGSGLIVLIPKSQMSDEELYSYASQIVKQSWRFSFGRMVLGSRLENLPIVEKKFDFSVSKYISSKMPKSNKKVSVKSPYKMIWIKISDLCCAERKYAPYMNELDLSGGKVPYVTTTELNNGVSVLCKEKPNFAKGQLSVSLDGTCGTTFYQFEDFIAGEKTAVLKLNEGKTNIPLLFYIASMIKVQSWRYHYGRKLSMERLKDFEIPLPINKKGEYDLDFIKAIVKNCYGFEELKQYF